MYWNLKFNSISNLKWRVICIKIVLTSYLIQICHINFVLSENNNNNNNDNQGSRAGASSYFAQYAKKSTKSPDPNPNPKEKEDILNSKGKKSFIPNTLFLRHAEVKLFSGHILNFLRVKCPRVDPVRINQLQIFVSSRTPEAIHYASDKKSAFNQLLSSLRTCSNSNNNQLNYFKLPLFSDQIMTTIHEMTNLNSEYFSTKVNSVKAWTGSVIDKIKQSVNIPFKNLLWNRWNSITKSNQIDEGEGIAKTDTGLKDNKGGKTKEIKYFVVKDKETSKWKLSTSASPSPSTPTSPSTTKSKIILNTKSEPKIDENNPGEKRFHEFLETLLKLYSKTCGKTKKLQIFFKAASNDLFVYFAIDSSRANRAAAKFLPPEFIQSVNECAM